MKNTILFKSQSGNDYLYDSEQSTTLYIPPILNRICGLKEKQVSDENICQVLMGEFDNYTNEDILYYLQKYNYLKECGFWKEIDYEKKLSTEISAKTIEAQLSNLDNLVFQVTNDCNLACRYCCYGDLYKNTFSQGKRMMDFEMAKKVIDYLCVYWESNLSLSHNNTIGIGFYGGEPLLNFKLISQIVSYVENLHLKNNPKFVFNMTTNGMLLNRYMDYLVEHNFSLLLSLDGDKEHDYLRVDKNNRESFDRVFANMKRLKEKYPEFFATHVNINSLLNIKSSPQKVYDFVMKEFGKEPMIASFSTNGLREDKKDAFEEIYQPYIEDDKIANKLKRKSVRYKDAGFFFYYHLGNSYKQYCDLLTTRKSSNVKIPTGTCLPFFKKMFVLINGDILACERIGLEHVLGKVDKSVHLNFSEIADLYNRYYSFVRKQCTKCFRADDCPECFFQFPFSSEGPICPHSCDEDSHKAHLQEIFTTIEENKLSYDIISKFVFA